MRHKFQNAKCGFDGHVCSVANSKLCKIFGAAATLSNSATLRSSCGNLLTFPDLLNLPQQQQEISYFKGLLKMFAYLPLNLTFSLMCYRIWSVNYEFLSFFRLKLLLVFRQTEKRRQCLDLHINIDTCTK